MTFNYIIALARNKGAEGMLQFFSKDDVKEIYDECERLLDELHDFPPIYTVKDIEMLFRISAEALENYKEIKI